MGVQGRRVHRGTPLVLCLLAVLFSGCGGSGGEVVPPTLKAVATPPEAASTAPKVVILGDSLTAGLGLPATESFPAILQRKIEKRGLHFEVANAGVSGDTSAGGLRRLDWALQDGARVLIVALGGNDGLRGLPVDEMKKNLAGIIEAARAKQVVVILAGMEAPPNYGGEYAAAFHGAFQDLSRKYGVPLVPFLLDKVAGQASLNQRDGIHPNARGAEIVADTVWTVLEPVLDRLSTS
jgi:acyl-CoA thioesterase-1